MTKSRMCRVCRCTERNACYDPKTGEGCRWVGRDICNVCDDAARSVRISRSMAGSLVYLITGKATSQARAVYIEGGLTHRSALRKRGLIDSEYLTSARRTLYWVTPLGREVVRRSA